MKARYFGLLVAALSASLFAQEEKGVPPLAPLSSLVAVTYRGSIPDRVALLVEQYVKGQLPEESYFPLDNKISDTVRSLKGFQPQVVARWLDPLSNDLSAAAPRFGANADFVCFFGDGWNHDWNGDVVGSSPFLGGASDKGWLWVNHEYVSNEYPTLTSAPTGQFLSLGQFLFAKGEMSDVTSSTWTQENLDTFIRWHKKQVGGTWMRIAKNRNGQWYVDREAANKRYDATSDTLVAITGYQPQRATTDDQGNPLPAGIAVGISGDCSGGQTPWGTVITAEENIQDYYGDYETCWNGSNRFIAGQGFDPGANITFDPAPSGSTSEAFGMTSNPAERHDRDHYGFLVEIDPGQDADIAYSSVNQGGDGRGHRKIGSAGRVRWENATFAVDEDWDLVDGQPIVIYGGNDRRSGRIYKFVSSRPYRKGMTQGQVRGLVDEGNIYVAHLAGLDHRTGVTLYDPANPTGGGTVPTETAPGQGRWIWLSTQNTVDTAPNAEGLGKPGTKVGQALQDITWNGIGGFRTDNDVRSAMFTAGNKLGVTELNRPEDLEYNPRDISGKDRIYVAFTNNSRPAANNQLGVLDATTPTRRDPYGSIFALEEDNNGQPGASLTFKYFRVWRGFGPDDNNDPAQFAAGAPDNIAIDKNGGVWFGTDGNVGLTGNSRADSIYYLDLDPHHKSGAAGVVQSAYGKAFRVASAPGDAEATGPWFTPDGSTLFFAVQHPGENLPVTPSTWPQSRELTKPTSDRNSFKGEEQ